MPPSTPVPERPPRNKRRSVLRSLSLSKEIWSSSSSTDAEVEESSLSLRRRSTSKARHSKLQRRPSSSATSSSSRSASLMSPRAAHPPLPFSAPNFQTSRTSLTSASEGHEVHPARPRSNKALCSTPDLPLRPLPLNSGPSPTTPGNQRRYIGHGRSPTLSAEQLGRRKGNMTKLMRHLGESRIPSDLLLTQPKEDALRDEQRAKSLDLRPLSGVFEETAEAPPRLARSRSLNLKVQRHDWEAEPVEPLPDFVNEELKRSIKRTRKITKILGPEVTHDLMTMLTEGKERSRAAEKPQLDTVPMEVSPVEDQAEEAPSLARRPSTDLARLAYDLTDDEGSHSPLESEPPTPITEHPPVDDRRRAQKLANFFGVDVSSHTSSVPPSTAQPTLPPAQQTMQSVTEIDVQISGRRFWGSPSRAEFKNAHMADAIHQLRALKAA